MQLSDIQQVIGKEWDTFKLRYRQQMRSDSPEITLITDYILSQPGKQLRPLLALLGASICGGINERSQVGAVIAELVHVGTLLHDDVVDEALERRGMPSVNAQWHSKIAILTGDFLFARAFLTAMEASAFDLLRILTSAIQDVGEGEVEQMQHAQTLDMTEPLYFEIIRKKTASLLQACAHIGAVSAGAKESWVMAMVSFGLNTGIAFQIRDDILDYYDEKNTGKKHGNDILERKLTLPLIYTLQTARKRERRHILTLVNSAKKKPDNIQEVMDFVQGNGGLEYAEQKISYYTAEAKGSLYLFPDSDTKNALFALTDYVAVRSK